MTCRSESTRDPLINVAASGPFPVILSLSSLSPPCFHNQDCSAGRPGSVFRVGCESTDPENLVSAHYNRPKGALRLRYMALLQQFLDLLGGFGVRRPEPVSRTPVPHPEWSRQRICIQELVWIILRHFATRNAPGFDRDPDPRENNSSGYGKFMLILLRRVRFAAVG